MAIGVAPTRTTTGRIGMWAGTNDGKPGYVDHVTGASNVIPPKHVPITVEDVRTLNSKPSLQANGYEIIQMPETISDEHLLHCKDEESRKLIDEVYVPECVRIIKELAGANVVIPYNTKLRVQDRKLGKATEARTGDGALPIAHVDRDHDSAATYITQLYGEEGEKLIKTHKRWASINIWRPVGSDVKMWPLGVVDTTGIPDWNYEDNMACVKCKNKPVDNTTAKSQDTVMVNDERLRFRYISNQTKEEAWVFIAFHSEDSKSVPHGAFWDDNTPADAPPRASFEVRTWCFIDEIKPSA